MRGSLQEVAAAEALVSSKLAACYEADATKSQAMLSVSDKEGGFLWRDMERGFSWRDMEGGFSWRDGGRVLVEKW